MALAPVTVDAAFHSSSKARPAAGADWTNVSCRGLSDFEPVSWVPKLVVRMVKSRRFEGFFGLFILGNCFMMGYQTELALHHKEDPVAVLVFEHIFTAVFLIELLLRIAVRGWRRLVPFIAGGGGKSDFFDAGIVLVTGVVPVWIMPWIGVPGDPETLRLLTVLRSLRLVRLVRVLRTEWFQMVWVLLRGLMDSMKMLFWTVVVIAFITYIFAIFGIVLVSMNVQGALHEAVQAGDHERVQDLTEFFKKFDGIGNLMFTLMQILTLDSWTELVNDTEAVSPHSWVFFFAYAALAVIVLMNVVTAVLVDHAMTASKKDAEDLVQARERAKDKAFKDFRSVFEQVDSDHSGTVTLEEFRSAFDDPQVGSELRALGLQVGDCEEIFQLLDEGNGDLSIQELFEGMRRMEGVATAKDLFRVLKRTERLSALLRTSLGLNTAPSSPSIRSSISLRHRMNTPTAASPAWRGAHPAGPGSGSPFTSKSDLPMILGGANVDVFSRLDSMAEAVAACDAKVDFCCREVRELRAGRASAPLSV